MDRVFTRPLQMPPRVHAVTVVDSAGDYNVYVNTRSSSQMQRIACQRELRHIRMNHFYDGAPVRQNEVQAES